MILELLLVQFFVVDIFLVIIELFYVVGSQIGNFLLKTKWWSNRSSPLRQNSCQIYINLKKKMADESNIFSFKTK